jgi:hypothetical protein
MKAAMRPVRDARDVAVLDGIEVNVVDVTLEVCLVADCMLPIASLPNTLLALRDLAPVIAVARPYRAEIRS